MREQMLDTFWRNAEEMGTRIANTAAEHNGTVQIIDIITVVIEGDANSCFRKKRG